MINCDYLKAGIDPQKRLSPPKNLFPLPVNNSPLNTFLHCFMAAPQTRRVPIYPILYRRGCGYPRSDPELNLTIYEGPSPTCLGVAYRRLLY